MKYITVEVLMFDIETLDLRLVNEKADLNYRVIHVYERSMASYKLMVFIMENLNAN